MKKILLVDGFSIMNRAFYALPPLTNSAGEHTGAVFGFMNILLKFVDEEKPDYITVAWDLPVPTFRHEQYGAYKGTRRAMPDELRQQVPTLKGLLEKMGFPAAECAGFEADDVIGTLAQHALGEGLQPVIISGDRDMLQLATDTLCIRLPKTKGGKTEVETYFAKDVLAKYGVTPQEFIDVKALMGDSSDNIPGVPGIGEVTATKIIAAFGSIENAIANIHDIKPPKAAKNLEEFAEQARLSKILATIVTDVPLTLELHETGEMFNPIALAEINRLELKQLARRFHAEGTGENTEGSTQGSTAASSIPAVNIIETTTQATAFFNDLTKAKTAAAFYCVRDEGALAGMALCTGDSFYYVDGDLTDCAHEWLRSDAPKFTHDTKTERAHWRKMGIESAGLCFDIMLAAYCIDTQNAEKTIPELAAHYLNLTVPTLEDLLHNKGKRSGARTKIIDLPVQSAADFAALNAYAIFHMRPLIFDELGTRRTLYDEIELPLAKVLANMEAAGIGTDAAVLDKNSTEMADRLANLTEEIYTTAGGEFNINSPAQLGSVLFEKLGLKGGKKTKQGYSTAADVLEKLRPAHPVVGMVLEYRALAKLKSTYIDGLLPLIEPETKRIHSTFRQALTATGRLSSVEPNLQNIPVRTAMGRELRRAFVPKAGCVFIDADYNQIELRLLAHMAKDEVLIKAFCEGQDIHRLTAAGVFNTALEKVTPAQRSAAKAVNFGIVYGISAFGLSEDLKIPVWEAEDYIAGYFERYPRVKAFMNECVINATQSGCASTIFDRRRSIIELKSHNHNIRQFGARAAMNMPIQGSAADIIKIAMLRVCKRLESEYPASQLILQVHDELLLEVPCKDADGVSALVLHEMQNAAALLVPLEVEIKSGESWYDAK